MDEVDSDGRSTANPKVRGSRPRRPTNGAGHDPGDGHTASSLRSGLSDGPESRQRRRPHLVPTLSPAV
jgi:hypothetical protein